MKLSRRRRRMYSDNYIAPARKERILTRISRWFLHAGAAVLGAVSVPFAALGALLEGSKHTHAPLPAALSAGESSPPIETAFAPAIPRTRHWGLKDIALVSAVGVSALFLGWSLLFSDNAVPVTITYHGLTRTILTKAETVGEFLQANDLRLVAGETIDAEPGAPVSTNMTIHVTSAFPVAVASGGEVTILYMQQGSVGDALAVANVNYDATDELTRLPYEDLTPGMHIRHIDVQIQYDTQDEAVEFREEIIKDDDEYTSFSEVQVAGEDGERRTVRRLVYKDGLLSSREIMNTISLKQSVTQVMRVGTKIRYQTSFTGEDRIWKPKPTKDEIKETMVAVEVTAYTHTGNRTATGRRTRIGYVAVNPKIIPYGTKLYVPGYGYCTAQDTGAFRHEDGGMKNQLDLFLNTEQECKKWGRKYNVTFYILK